MPTSDKSEHSRDDLWGRINKQSESIAEIRAGQAATDARLGALESAVEQGFRSIAAEIHGLGERVHKPATSPITLFLGLFATLTMFGSFALLIADPVEADAAGNRRDIDRLEDKVLESRERIAASEARDDMLQRQLDAVDIYGSRHWVDRSD